MLKSMYDIVESIMLRQIRRIFVSPYIVAKCFPFFWERQKNTSITAASSCHHRKKCRDGLTYSKG